MGVLTFGLALIAPDDSRSLNEAAQHCACGARAFVGMIECVLLTHLKLCGLPFAVAAEGSRGWESALEAEEAVKRRPQPVLPDRVTRIGAAAAAARAGHRSADDVTLVARLVPWARHEHLRRPRADVAAAYTAALADACATRAAWRALRACAAPGERGSGARLAPRAEGDRTIVVNGVERREVRAP